MSKQEEVAIVGTKFVELREAQQKLACWKARAQEACKPLRLAEKLLCPKGQGKTLADVPELPTSAGVAEILNGIEEQTQIIESRIALLQGMGFSIPAHKR